MIRKCTASDFERIYEIINDAAQEYNGVIPAEYWKWPYMSRDELKHELDEGIEMWGYEEGTTDRRDGYTAQTKCDAYDFEPYDGKNIPHEHGASRHSNSKYCPGRYFIQAIHGREQIYRFFLTAMMITNPPYQNTMPRHALIMDRL